MNLASLVPRRSSSALPVLLGLLLLNVKPDLEAQSLLGSHESLLRQNLVAQQHSYEYLRTSDQVLDLVQRGVLVSLPGNADYQIAGGEVSFPYARPEVKVFAEALGRAYRSHCGEPLVVTSLTRPIAQQPRNASVISVHPTGMALDMRRSDRHGCRQWMDSTLLTLEGEGMIEATLEHFPPHYHVSVFPDSFLAAEGTVAPAGVVRLAGLAGTPLEPMQIARVERAVHHRGWRTARGGGRV
ncbi:MAG: DUF5715 family protein, partial [Acidobacteriota bacterium]|nr:DUF5715 family protein [Acidobacteriota bacterium]